MMPLDFVPLWTLILGFGVFMYVLMDGFDLGVGILFRRAPGDAARDIMMNSVAPIWDGNETWLVLGGVALLAAFPLAFAIILPALYFPLLIMLMALIFRGIAFELRFKASPQSRHRWDAAFHYGSLVATLAQGFVLGAFVQGFRVEGRFFAGGSFDWLTPFSVLTAISLTFGYALLGATWLIMKTEGTLQDWARQQARWLMGGVLVSIGIVSLWTPFLEPRIWARWFSWPNIALLSPGADRHRLARPVGLALDRSPCRIPAVHRHHRAVHHGLCGARHQPVAEHRSAFGEPVGCGRRTALAGFPAGGHALPPAGDRRIHGVVLLGLSRQGSRRGGLPLENDPAAAARLRILRRPRARANRLAMPSLAPRKRSDKLPPLGEPVCAAADI